MLNKSGPYLSALTMSAVDGATMYYILECKIYTKQVLTLETGILNY